MICCFITAHADAKLTFKPVSNLMPELNAASIASLASAALPFEVHVDGHVKLMRGQAVLGADWIAVGALDNSEATAGVRSFLTTSAIALIVIDAVAVAIVNAVTAAAFKRISITRDVMGGIGSGTGDLT